MVSRASIWAKKVCVRSSASSAVQPRLRAWADAEQRPFDRAATVGDARLALILVAIYAGLRGAAWVRMAWLGF